MGRRHRKRRIQRPLVKKRAASNLPVAIAERHVIRLQRETTEPSVNREAAKCDDFLNRGLQSFQWISQADATMREGECEGIAEYSAELQQHMHKLCVDWLKVSEYAREWAESVLKSGRPLRNLDEIHVAREKISQMAADFEAEKSLRSNMPSHAELLAMAKRCTPPAGIDEDDDSY